MSYAIIEEMDTTKRILEEVAAKVRRARLRADLTQRQVADALHMSMTGYNSYETMARDLPVEVLCALPEILGCRITDLLPDGIVTPADRERAKDVKLEQITSSWPLMTDRTRRQLWEMFEILREIAEAEQIQSSADEADTPKPPTPGGLR